MNNILPYNNTIIISQNSQVNNPENHNIYNDNHHDYENNIFFNKYQNYKLADIPGENIVLTKIDAKYLTSIDEFMIFVANKKFASILLEFEQSIREFVKVTNLYIEEEDARKDFNNGINNLIDKIKDTRNYFALGNGVINLFAITRVNLAKIVKIITQLNQYHSNSELTTQEVKSFYNQCNITYDNLKQLLYNSITDIDACLNGVNVRFLALYNTIEAFFMGKLGLLENKKNELVETLIQAVEIDLINHSEVKYNSEISVHFHTALRNILADTYGFQTIEDDYAKIFDISYYLTRRIKDIAELELLPVNITRSLVDDLIVKFKILLSAHDCLPWLTQSLPTEYFIDNNIFVELDENFFKICNAQYSAMHNNSYLESELQQNSLKFHNLINIEYKQDKEFYSIKDIDSKLHAWVVSLYLPISTHKLVVDVSNQELMTNEHALAIATIGNCYFWVINKNLIENKKIFDFNNQIQLQLSYIPVDICKHVEKNTYIPLIIQALKQTNNAKVIINFFNRKDIYHAIKNNLIFIEYINNVLSTKISSDIDLKNSLINMISSDPNYTYDINCKQYFNIKNSYWFTSSKLLEPILNQLNRKKINIYTFINQLTITQLLTFENELSLRKLCSFIVENSEYNLINENYFYRLFVNLPILSASKVVKYLLYSGLIDNILITSDDQGNNILMMAIVDRDIDIINILIDINSKLDKTKQLNINLQNKQKKTALILATETGRCEYIKAIFRLNKDNKIDFNKQDEEGLTALMHAIDLDNYEMIIELFDQASQALTFINCDIKNRYGYTAMMSAVSYSNEISFLALMQSYKISILGHDSISLNIFAKNYLEQTTLTIILEHNESSLLTIFLKTIKEIINENSTAINIENFKTDIYDSLMYALDQNYNEQICHELITQVKTLLGININFNLAKKQIIFY